MKKEELLTIIKKIQNRCYLEDPVKVTYYWNEDHKVVFKIYFESLYLPKELRIGKDTIQNTFVTQNVYEYEDDFEILELNQDQGYIKVLPDNQNFKVINSYKAANAPETKEESSLVHLASSYLKENFATSKGYLLQEGTPDTEEDKKEKTKANVYVIGLALATGKNNSILDLLNRVPSETDGVANKLFFTVPKVLQEDTERTKFASIRYFSDKVYAKMGGQDTYAYLAHKGNETATKLLQGLDIQKTFFLTDTAEKGIEEANLPSLLETKADLPNGNVVQDTTVASINEAYNLAMPLIESFKKATTDNKKFKKNWANRQKALDNFQKDLSKPTFNVALIFCQDLYGKNALAADRAIAQQRAEIINKGFIEALNLGNNEDVRSWSERLNDAQKAAAASAAFVAGDLMTHTGEKTQATDGGGLFGKVDMGGAAGGVAATDSKKDKSTKNAKDVSVTYADFETYITTTIEAELNPDFERLMEVFADDAKEDPAVVNIDELEDTAEKNDTEKENLKKNDTEKKDDSKTNDQSAEETNDDSVEGEND